MGKGADAMARAAVRALGRARHDVVGGVVVGPTEPSAPPAHPSLAVLRGDHPLPGRGSFTAAARIGDAATRMRSGDSALVLLSGGCTSLIAAPLRGMAESDLGHLFELLLGSGLDIHAMNLVRKRFTCWGGGRLALALAPARTTVLIMSDVPGDSPADVGSGPCEPDDSTVADVVELLRASSLLPRLPASMHAYLRDATRGVIPETPKRSHPAFAHVSSRVIGNNRLALEAVVRAASAKGILAELAGETLVGDAARCGATVADLLLRRAAEGWRGVVVWGGETTVRLAPPPPASGRHGALPHLQLALGTPQSGGRCQELALAAARALARGGEPGERVTLLAAGTDGRDGPTDAAGAFADATVWERIRGGRRDPEAALASHDSHAALDAAGVLLRRGLTGTNVMDVVIALVE